MNIPRFCLCGGQQGYPCSHTYDCPRPDYGRYEDFNGKPINLDKVEAWNSAREAKGARLRGEPAPVNLDRMRAKFDKAAVQY